MSTDTDTISRTFAYCIGPGRCEETRRVARLLGIVVAIGTQPGYWTRALLAARYDVSERMITRDLTIIRHGLGYAIERGSVGRGYSFVSPPSLRWLDAA